MLDTINIQSVAIYYLFVVTNSGWNVQKINPMISENTHESFQNIFLYIVREAPVEPAVHTDTETGLMLVCIGHGRVVQLTRLLKWRLM